MIRFSRQLIVCLALVGVCLLPACSTSSVDPTDTSTTTKVAFEHATAKPIFDTYCASCHASGKSNYRDWLYDPADYTTTIKGKISTIYSEVYVKKTMPEGTKLSATELAAFKAWYDAGYLAK